jgi:hypothetical protein
MSDGQHHLFRHIRTPEHCTLLQLLLNSCSMIVWKELKMRGVPDPKMERLPITDERSPSEGPETHQTSSISIGYLLRHDDIGYRVPH